MGETPKKLLLQIANRKIYKRVNALLPHVSDLSQTNTAWRNEGSIPTPRRDGPVPTNPATSTPHRNNFNHLARHPFAKLSNMG
jgi:hypothetical protein